MRNLNVTQVGNTSVVLQWMIPEYPNGAITRYTIDYVSNRDKGNKNTVEFINQTIIGVSYFYEHSIILY